MQENKLADEINQAKAQDDPAPAPHMDVDMADGAAWPLSKENSTVDTPGATPSATPDPHGGPYTSRVGHVSKRLKRNSWAHDDSAEHAAHVDTAASTECEEDAPGDEPAVGVFILSTAFMFTIEG